MLGHDPLDEFDYDEDLEDLEDVEDEAEGWPEDAPSMEDMGLCPHGYADDEDCDQCLGGSYGWDDEE